MSLGVSAETSTPTRGSAEPASTSAESRSVGTSTNTGRLGAAIAVTRASATSPPSASGSSARNVALVTGANIARWSGTSCSRPRCTPSRRRVVGTSVAITTTGEREAQASPTAPSVFAAPGPVVTRATPTFPLARAYPSAA